MPDSLSEQSRKVGNDVVNKLRHTVDRFENRLTLDNLRLVERYLEMNTILIIEFNIGTPPHKFVAYLQREAPYGHPGSSERGERFGERLSRMTSVVDILQHLQISWPHIAERAISRRNQQTVLVDIVKLVQVPERPISTFVWFDRPDRIFRLPPRELYFSLNSGFEFRGVVGDREINVLEGAGLPGSDADKLMSEMIEGVADVVDSVPCDEGDAQGHIITAGQIADALSGLRIVLDVADIGVSCIKRGDLALEIVDVLFGPFNL